MKRSKKLIALILAVLTAVLALSFAACGGKDDDTKNKTDANASANGLSTDGKFVIGFDPTFEPYGYKNESGAYVGFDLDLANEVAKKNGWQVVFQPIDWKAKDSELESGTIDCIWNGFTMSEDRLNSYTWSDPYVDSSQVIVVKKSSGIKKLADLKGKTVDVQAASSALEALNDTETKKIVDLKASFKKLVEVKDYSNAFLDLESGTCDAIAIDIGVAKSQIEARGSDKYMILEESIKAEQYAIGFKLGNEKLRDIVQDTLNKLAEEGVVLKYAKQYGIENDLILGKKAA